MLPSSQSESGRDGNEVLLSIAQISFITGTLPSDCIVSNPRHSLGGALLLCRDAIGVFYSPSRLNHRTFVGQSSYPSAEMKTVYSIAPAHWSNNLGYSCSYVWSIRRVSFIVLSFLLTILQGIIVCLLEIVCKNTAIWKIIVTFVRALSELALSQFEQLFLVNHIYQPLRSGKMWHKVNF